MAVFAKYTGSNAMAGKKYVEPIKIFEI